MDEISQYEIPISVWEQGQQAIGEYLASIKQPVDYKTLVGDQSQITFFGEYHTNTPIRQEIQANAYLLREAGVSTFLLEAPDTEQQRVLFQLLNAGDFSRIDETDVIPLPEHSGIEMVKALQKVGIELVPIDHPTPRSAPQNTREATLRRNIEAAIRDKEKKVVGLIGSAHVNREQGKFTVINLLERKGYDCKVNFFVGGLHKGRFINRLILEPAKIAGIDREKFMFHTAETKAPFGGKADWIVHLPQIK